jgi:hypothetical protein
MVALLREQLEASPRMVAAAEPQHLEASEPAEARMAAWEERHHSAEPEALRNPQGPEEQPEPEARPGLSAAREAEVRSQPVRRVFERVWGAN